jgi:hypothetical protein
VRKTVAAAAAAARRARLEAEAPGGAVAIVQLRQEYAAGQCTRWDAYVVPKRGGGGGRVSGRWGGRWALRGRWSGAVSGHFTAMRLREEEEEEEEEEDAEHEEQPAEAEVGAQSLALAPAEHQRLLEAEAGARGALEAARQLLHRAASPGNGGGSPGLPSPVPEEEEEEQEAGAAMRQQFLSASQQQQQQRQPPPPSPLPSRTPSSAGSAGRASKHETRGRGGLVATWSRSPRSPHPSSPEYLRHPSPTDHLPPGISGFSNGIFEDGPEWGGGERAVLRGQRKMLVVRQQRAAGSSSPESGQGTGRYAVDAAATGAMMMQPRGAGGAPVAAPDLGGRWELEYTDQGLDYTAMSARWDAAQPDVGEDIALLSAASLPPAHGFITVTITHCTGLANDMQLLAGTGPRPPPTQLDLIFPKHSAGFHGPRPLQPEGWVLEGKTIDGWDQYHHTPTGKIRRERPRESFVRLHHGSIEHSGGGGASSEYTFPCHSWLAMLDALPAHAHPWPNKEAAERCLPGLLDGHLSRAYQLRMELMLCNGGGLGSADGHGAGDSMHGAQTTVTQDTVTQTAVTQTTEEPRPLPMGWVLEEEPHDGGGGSTQAFYLYQASGFRQSERPWPLPEGWQEPQWLEEHQGQQPEWLYVHAVSGKQQTERPRPLPRGWVLQGKSSDGWDRYLHKPSGKTQRERPRPAIEVLDGRRTLLHRSDRMADRRTHLGSATLDLRAVLGGRWGMGWEGTVPLSAVCEGVVASSEVRVRGKIMGLIMIRSD